MYCQYAHNDRIYCLEDVDIEDFIRQLFKEYADHDLLLGVKYEQLVQKYGQVYNYGSQPGYRAEEWLGYPTFRVQLTPTELVKAVLLSFPQLTTMTEEDVIQALGPTDTIDYSGGKRLRYITPVTGTIVDFNINQNPANGPSNMVYFKPGVLN